MSSEAAGSQIATSQDYQPEKNGHLSPGDAMIEAIADAVALRLERMAGMRQRLLDIHQASEYLGMSEHALRHKSGVDLPCARINGKLRFERRDLEDQKRQKRHSYQQRMAMLDCTSSRRSEKSGLRRSPRR